MPAMSAPKPEPIDTSDTRLRIKEAAQRLFAERGVEAVTVREIVAEAGAKNGGSLNYYFGSKEDLISELLADVLRISGIGWLEGLSRMEKAGGPHCVRDIISVIVYGPDRFVREDPYPTSSRFLASVLFTRRRTVRELMNQLDFSVFARLLGYIQVLRPEIAPPVMRQRLIFLAWYLISVLSAHEAFVASRRRTAEWTEFDPLANIIDTATGLIEAPVSDEESIANRRKTFGIAKPRAAAPRKKTARSTGEK
jgi:AcrR family transcriptional regulator